MSSGTINQSPYLRTSRSFPEDDVAKLALEVNRSYVDIAEKVNKRTISLYPTTKPVVNGESWFLVQNKRQQGFRQVYTFTGPGPTFQILHGIIVPEISQFTHIYGTFTDGDRSYPLPYVSIVALSNQVQLNVGQTKIFISAGATAPTIVSGTIVLEWISEP